MLPTFDSEGWGMIVAREQELEDEIELLRQQLEAFKGSSAEVGVLQSLGFGMTNRMAMILHILVRRAPAIVSRNALHAIFYGDRSDGGPEPKIFSVNITRLRKVLRRVGADGQIATVWSAGYRASPELVAWVHRLYQTQIKEN